MTHTHTYYTHRTHIYAPHIHAYTQNTHTQTQPRMHTQTRESSLLISSLLISSLRFSSHLLSSPLFLSPRPGLISEEREGIAEVVSVALIAVQRKDELGCLNMAEKESKRRYVLCVVVCVCARVCVCVCLSEIYRRSTLLGNTRRQVTSAHIHHRIGSRAHM